MKRKNIVFAFLSTLFCCLSLATFFGERPYKNVDADYHYTILESGSFTEEITISATQYTIKCFRILDNDTAVAVAWGQAANSIPNEFTLPSSITSSKPTGSSVSYDVVAIARAGFAHCTFTSITLPQSVQDIREEAFAYCQNLTSFQFPKDVSIISPSTFLDCRNLVSIYYSEIDGSKTNSNNVITSIGNHAFDSCISLRRIQCPNSATFFGQSCFQKCSSLTKFRFPNDNELEGENRNYITVEPYAFADCAVLRKVYFDINMKYVSDYAFADSRNDLTFYFYGDKDEDIPATFEAKWRNKKITTDAEYIDVVYDIIDNQIKEIDGGYPGLTCVLSDQASKLDNARTNDTINIIDAVAPGDRKYAIITGFEVPEEDDWDVDYYSDGVLIIPDTISEGGVDYTVKVIGEGAFEDKSELQEVHFNEHLVQIRHHAFFHSNNISVLDFSDCTDLIEISYSIFNEIIIKKNATGTIDNATNNDIEYGTGVGGTLNVANINSVMRSITLPNSLQYIGNFAFYNFTRLTGTNAISFKTNPALPSNLKVMGDYAFAVCSGNKNNNDTYYKIGTTADKNGEANVDLVLPYSLSDAASIDANIYHSFTYDVPSGGRTVNQAIWNRVAIFKNAFENQDAIRTVTMETGGSAHDISFGTNVFVRCSNLLRFEASENLCLIGHDCFKKCGNLRELFFTADRSYNNTSACDSNGVPNGTKVANPWGVEDGSNNKGSNRNILTSEEAYKNIVIYIKGSSSSNHYPNNNNAWYTTGNAYVNDLSGKYRSSLPVYYVDWTTEGVIKYWHKNSSTDALVNLSSGPKTLNDYNNGYVAMCKDNGNNYTITRYYTDGSGRNVSNTIDLTSSSLSSINIYRIGIYAFGSESSNLGYYFILPTSITSIEDRGFYRKDVSKGVRIVTFKNGGTAQVYNSAPGGSTFESLRTAADGGAAGYCCLSSSITRINNNAFYNNRFGNIELYKGTVKLYNNAFYVHSTASDKMNGKITSIDFTDYSGTFPDTNSYYTVVNDGLYYTKEATAGNNYKNKCLFFQDNGKTGTLNVDSNTVAIYYGAAASCNYSEVNLNGTYTIYGRAFKNCYNLETLSGTNNLKYICNESGVAAQYKIGNISTYVGNETTNNDSAFENCASLKIDFSTMPAIEKIGSTVFKGCTNLVNLSLNKTYQFYSYTSAGGEVSITDAATNVLDLSTLANFNTVGKETFANCNINYAILPNTTGTNYTSQSNFYCTSGNPFNGTTNKILCGETVLQADPNAKSSPLTTSQITSHYNSGGLNSNYTVLYYRVHSSSDIDNNIPTTRRYWTAVTTGNTNIVKIIMFESKDDAAAWFAVPGNDSRQLHLFPES